MENERKQLLNGLSDAIKECQLRFGGKRELATDIDSRVCILCIKLEAIFMHGLKKKAMLNSNSSQSSILTSTLQLNSIINLKQKTGNLISQFFDENKLNLIQTNSQSLVYNENDLSFWPFIKNLMNKFDIERYELLNNIKSSTGRQRAWLRSCLNEHCLERFTIAVLANETLTNQYYEEWSFLLDKTYNSTLPMLISGLESILFAINIDNPNLNIPSKLGNNKMDSSPVRFDIDNENKPDSMMSTSYSESTIIKIKKPINNINTTNRKLRKNNVVVLDNEDKTPTCSDNKPIRSRSVFSSTSSSSSTSSNQNRTSILANPINYLAKKDDLKTDETSCLKKLKDSDLSFFETDSNSLKNEVFAKSIEKSIDVNDISTDSSAEADIYKFDSAANLIPLNPSFNAPNTVDTISINSYQSENSNEINFNQNYKANNNLNVNGSYNAQTFNISPSSLNSLKSIELNNNNRTSTIIASDYDGLSLKEMRDFVLTMIQRKEDLELKFKKLDENYKIELKKSKEINDKFTTLEYESKQKHENYDNRVQNLESENKLLKDQLKKYVSAVQMIRSNTNTNSPTDQSYTAIPAINPNLQRDYSFEAEQYEKKLIQVAEMHGELMEFNSRLHKILNFKTIQIEKLKQELTELRGPLPNELMNENSDETFSMLSDIESINNLNSPLINIWIPSAFLRSNKSDSHHVYQIYIRIRDEEWNIYRRFSHFHNLNSKLKEKYPGLNTFKFPKKKAIGNKDAKFVENRRKMLQDYLRQTVNKVSQLDRDLSLKPCRETLSKTIPFLSDQHFYSSGNSVERERSISAVQNFANPAFGNSLGHIVRNNTFLEASEVFSNSPILNNNSSLLHINNANEPLYTGL